MALSDWLKNRGPLFPYETTSPREAGSVLNAAWNGIKNIPRFVGNLIEAPVKGVAVLVRESVFGVLRLGEKIIEGTVINFADRILAVLNNRS